MLRRGLISSKGLLPQSHSLVFRRTFLISALGAFTNSEFIKNIRLVDEFEDITSKPKNPQRDALSNTPTSYSKTLPDGRIDISTPERAILLVVSGLSAFLHPEVGANINNFGEASSFDFILRNLRNRMLETESGRGILREKPLLNKKTLAPEWLKGLPENTLGYHYYKFTESGDERAPVKFIKDDELAYVFLRYRQIHDIVHILTDSKIDLVGELPVKAFEFGNTGLPMTGLACFAYFKLSSKRKSRINILDSFLNGLQSTPLVTVRWEDLMERDVDELRVELGIKPDNK